MDRNAISLLPMIALLAGETFQMINVRSSSHHHLEGRDWLVARRAVASVAEHPEIVPLAEYEISFRIQGGADFP